MCQPALDGTGHTARIGHPSHDRAHRAHPWHAPRLTMISAGRQRPALLRHHADFAPLRVLRSESMHRLVLAVSVAFAIAIAIAVAVGVAIAVRFFEPLT